MEATVNEHGGHGFRNQGVVLGTVGLAVASAIALGVFHLMQSVDTAPQEPDTTAYLLSGPNGEALRAAIKRRKQGQYVAYNPLDA